MKVRRAYVAIAFALVVLAAAAIYAAQGLLHPTAVALTASGTINAEQSSVTADVAGRVVEIDVHEGQSIAANAIVAQLDSQSAADGLASAQAAAAHARAQLDRARNGARPEDKAQADAAVAQALAAREGARRAWDDALAVLENPQDLDAQIADARTRLAVAAQQIDAAQAQQAQAAGARDQYRGDGSDLGKTLYASYDLQVRAAQESILAATSQHDGAQAALDDLLAIRKNPLDLLAQSHSAQARWQVAEAAYVMAQAARDLVYAGATKEDIAIAEAGVAQAEAGVKAAQVRLDKLTLRAPVSGTVSQRLIDVGQVVAVGTDAFTIIHASTVTLTVYFPEDQIGRVHVGQAARVAVDSFPGRVFDGRVSFISPSAEFTPKNVQTVEGRVSQVFAVKIRMENSDLALKSGMPADATLLP